MRKALAALVLALCVAGPYSSAALAANSWLMPGHDAQSTNFNPGEATISQQNVSLLRTVWTHPGVVQAIATAKRVFAIVATGSLHHGVVVLNAGNGRVLHTFTPATLRLSSQPYDDPIELAYGQGKLVVAAVSAVMAINPDTGQQYWHTPGGANRLTISGGTVYTAKTCQNPCGGIASQAIDLTSGRVRWQHRENGGGRPVLVASRLYQVWGQYNPETRVYDPDTGGLVATVRLSAWWTGDRANAYAAVGASGGKPGWLGEIGSTGKPRWEVNLGKVAGTSLPVLAYHTLYVASNRFHPGLLAVNAGSGQVRWAADLGQNLIAIAANHLIFALHQSSGQVDVLNAGTGQTVTRLTARGYSAQGFPPDMFVSAGTLYIQDGKRLYASRPPASAVLPLPSTGN